MEPFWECLDRFFIWPFNRSGMSIILLCCLPAMLPLPPGLGWIAPLLALLLASIFAAPVLANIARGRIKSVAPANPLQQRFVQLSVRLLILAIIALMFSGAAWLELGPAAGAIVLGLCLFIVQGSTIILSRRASLDKALGPGFLANVIRSLGKVYVLLWLYLLAVISVALAMTDLVLTMLPQWAAQVIAAGLAAYMMLMMAYCLGYVSLQYRQVDLFKADSPSQADGMRTRDRQVLVPVDQKLQQVLIDMALKDGDLDAVESRLKHQLLLRPHDKAVLDRFIRLVNERGEWEKLDAMKVPVLRLLLETTRDKDICAFLKHRLQHNPDFELHDSELLYGVARTLYFNGEHRLLLRLLNQLETRLPDLPRLVDCLHLIACSLANGLQKADKARAYLKHIQKQYPQHHATGSLPLLLQRLEVEGRLPEPSVNFSTGVPGA